MEEFCNHLAAGFSQSEAARRAGYARDHAANVGCRMAKREDVRQRVLELSGDVGQDTGKVSGRTWIISETVQLHRDCRREKQYAVSKSCLEFLARLQGFLVDRKEQDTRRLNVNVNSATELRAVLRSQAEVLPEDERLAIEGECAAIEEKAS